MTMAETLFLLEAVTFTRKRRRHRYDYQPFETEITFVSFHERRDEAEAAIRRVLDEWRATCDFYCFYIRQVPYGHCCPYPGRRYYGIDSYAAWLYDPEGNMIDERPYPTYAFGCHFSGRPASKLRFHVGDVVESEGELGIVVSVPREHYDRMLDESDDCYCIISLEQDFDEPAVNHSHPECISVMPPRFPISPEVMQQIERVKAWYASLCR